MIACITSLTVAAALVFVAGAIPIEDRQLGAQTETFDGLTTPTVVSLESVGVYQGLNYSGICT